MYIKYAGWGRRRKFTSKTNRASGKRNCNKVDVIT
jgi:hypothetical protein